MGPNYVVCECTGVTAGQIESAVKNGKTTFEEMKEYLGVGKQCIKCKDFIQFLIEGYMED